MQSSPKEYVKEEEATLSLSPLQLSQSSETLSSETEQKERKQKVTLEQQVEQVDKSKLPHLLTKTVVGTAIPIFTHVMHLRQTVHHLDCKTDKKVSVEQEKQESTQESKQVNEKDKHMEPVENNEENKRHYIDSNNNDFARYDPVSMHIVAYINTTPPKLSIKRERVLEEWNRCSGLELHLQPPALQDYSYDLDRKKTVLTHPTLLPVATLRVRHEVDNCWTKKRQKVTFVDRIYIMPKPYAEAALRALLIKMEEASMKVFHSTVIVICDSDKDEQFNLRRKVMQQNGYAESKKKIPLCHEKVEVRSCVYYMKELNTLTSFTSSHL